MRIFKLLKTKLFIGFILGLTTVFLANRTLNYTSSDKFCDYCHVHPHVTETWRLSTHYDNKSGIVVHCIECHLPPGGIEHYTEKSRLGAKDIFGKIFKDASKINWEAKSQLENAKNYTYRESCLKCHQNLFPLKLTKKGEEAHLYYTRKKDQIRCINCHLYVGHYSEQAQQAILFGKTETITREIYTQPAEVEKFEDFTEFIPGSRVDFEMAAVPEGIFTMGSPVNESYRDKDEGPQRKVAVSKFWMSKTEVTWDEYEAFYRQTAAALRGGAKPEYRIRNDDLEIITGATPPYGFPDQGWGKGKRPAITMTHYAAEMYCRWLSQVTGKKYRLPTEAEWEYACSAGSDEPYFFGGDPEKYTKRSFWNKIFGADTVLINSYAVYSENSGGKTHPAERISPNRFGLLNMPGNVREFCSDYYSPDAYSNYSEDEIITDPKGPETGTEHVLRGGSYKSDAVFVRSAARDRTRHDSWLLTDPQIPKSKWWYSDCTDVGFRVVCDYEEKKLN
ncbi:SUMF1/EgtB/PvdO family nonheme iron enzyme [candidate division KSB1 bacterium]